MPYIRLRNLSKLSFSSTATIRADTTGLVLCSSADNKACIAKRPAKGNFYFEVLVNKEHVRVGLAPKNYNIYGPLGLKNSYAFGSVKGYKYHRNIRNAYGRNFGVNDVISVLKIQNFLKFFVNGVDMGLAFDSLLEEEYFPAISFYAGGSVSVNFGPCFAYDSVIKYETAY